MDLEPLSTQRLMSREWLLSVRRRALRRGVWFGVLSRAERGVVDLTISCVGRVRSARLALVISRIVCKVLKAFKSRFLERVDRVGCEVAEKISKIAVGWGYVGASSWRRDLSFIRYLGVNAVSNNSGWGQV